MQESNFYAKVQKLVETSFKEVNEHNRQISELHKLLEKANTIKRGTSVRWNSSGGIARGKVTKIITSGSEQVPGSSFTITGSKEDPAALIRVYKQDSDGKYKPTDTIVGHKLSTLTKIADLD